MVLKSANDSHSFKQCHKELPDSTKTQLNVLETQSKNKQKAEV